MRLKGGKVLIDLTKYNIAEDILYQCSDEELKAILDKGVSVKIFNGVNCVIDLIPNSVGVDTINYDNLTFFYGESQHNFGVSLNISAKTLGFIEN